MKSDSEEILKRRQDQFEDFYNQLIRSLVYFAKRLGIEPAHEILGPGLITTM